MLFERNRHTTLQRKMKCLQHSCMSISLINLIE
jgi:hypothetical protein